MIIGVVVIGLIAVNLLSPADSTQPASAPAAANPLALPPMPTATGRDIYVSPEGKSTNPGTRQSPVDLATALSSNTPASPGDTIWLQHGTYVGNFTSVLSGTAAGTFQVRQAPGARAVIQAARLDQPALLIDGGFAWYRDFEVTASPAARSQAMSAAVDVRSGGGVRVQGSDIGLHNLVVHDLPKGIEVSQSALRTVVAGNIVYYSWWPDPPLGVGIRTAPTPSDQFVVGNIVFNQGGAGIFAGLASGGRLLLRGNVSFNNGLHGEYYDRNLLVEGGSIRVARNYTYYEAKRGGGENNFGYSSGCARIEASENYFAHRAYPFTLSKCQGTLSKNTFIGPVDPSVVARYPDNVYERSTPTGLQTFVNPDPYDPGRAQIVIYNWDRHPVVNADISAANLPPGTPFEVRDALDYYGAPVLTGVYEGGRIGLPAKGRIATPAADRLTSVVTHTAPEFLVFVINTTLPRAGEVTGPPGTDGRSK